MRVTVVVGYLGVLRADIDVFASDTTLVRVSRGKRDFTEGGD